MQNLYTVVQQFFFFSTLLLKNNYENFFFRIKLMEKYIKKIMYDIINVWYEHMIKAGYHINMHIDNFIFYYTLVWVFS